MEDPKDIVFASRSPSSQRQIANAAMERWYFQNADKISRSQAGLKGTPSILKCSAKDMFKHYESKKIIESPREFQMEMFEKAKAQNTIVVLETGMPGVAKQPREHRELG